MRLSDAALIATTLKEAAKAAVDAADYLESDRYAAIRPDGWVPSQDDLDRVSEYRTRAARLSGLAES